ncbi:MAG: cell division topological specificity factor MinE [Phormidesmis sp.]
MTIPIISELLGRLFSPGEDIHSRDDVKRRLQIVLAHDRLALDPQALEMMRQEIIAVVSRYVEVDFDSLEFSIATDQRITALTANLPIRRIRPLGRGADQPLEPAEEAEKIELAAPEKALDAQVVDPEAALRRFKENSRTDPDLVHSPLDIDRSDMAEEDFELLDVDSDESWIAQAERLEDTSAEGSDADSSDLLEDTSADSSETVSLPEELTSGVPVPEVPDMSVTDSSVPAARTPPKRVKSPKKAT